MASSTRPAAMSCSASATRALDDLAPELLLSEPSGDQSAAWYARSAPAKS